MNEGKLGSRSVAIGNQNLALRAIYRSRSTGGRIDLADVLMREAFNKAGLTELYEETLGGVRHCLKIRNQYAHCHWAYDDSGIYFTNLEDAANRIGGFEYDHKHVDLKLVKEQEAFFDYMKDLLLYFGDQISTAIDKRKTPSCPKPQVLSPPNPHISVTLPAAGCASID
jgi:hypothetical protein